MNKVNSRFWYTVYEAFQDRLVVIGSSRECAAYMGCSAGSFRSIVSKVKSGKNRAYCIVVEDLVAGTYSVYGAENTGDRLQTVDYELVEDLYYQRMSDVEIARRLNVNQTTIWKWREKEGLPPVGKRGRRRKVVA